MDSVSLFFNKNGIVVHATRSGTQWSHTVSSRSGLSVVTLLVFIIFKGRVIDLHNASFSRGMSCGTEILLLLYTEQVRSMSSVINDG